MYLQDFLNRTQETGVWDIDIAARILEIEIDYANGRPSSAKSRTANIIKSSLLLNDSRAVYEIILTCSQTIASIDLEFATSALSTVINSKSSTKYQTELAKIILKNFDKKESFEYLSNSYLIEWMIKSIT